MYNQATSELIQGVPDVPGIDSRSLPELLTEAYAAMAALRLRASGPDSHDHREMVRLKAKLRQLAVVLGIYAAMAPNSERRSSAAFVAASAYQLLHLSNRFTAGEVVEPSIVSAKHVSSDLAAALLFLASGHPADAAEMATVAQVVPDAGFRGTMAAAVRSLARSTPGEVRVATLAAPDGLSLEDRAELLLWNKILACMRGLANRLLGQELGSNGGIANYLDVLNEVRAESIMRIDDDFGFGEVGNSFSALSGPHHLATLLLAAAHGVEATATIDIPPPAPVDAEKWREFLTRRSRTRPLLWANHQHAIVDGLLNSGRSATISFPTGAGKSTLSELKIAAAVLRGRKVVYLAPTHALISQVVASLTDALSGTVQASLVEDSQLADVEEPLSGDVSVMTPERALLLATLYPDVFGEVGLIVFDECHLLHLDEDEHSRRPMDAMLSLLLLLKVAPDADAILISAMMANGEELANWLTESLGKDARHYGEGWKPTRQARGCVVYFSKEIDALLGSAKENRLLRRNKPHRLMQAKPYCLVGLKQTWVSSSEEHYKILAITDQKAQLSLKSWTTLDAEKIDVAVQLAGLSASRRLKTIVFVQDPRSIQGMCDRTTVPKGVIPYRFSPEELECFNAAATELGGSDHVYVPFGVSGGHFGGMLPHERELIEKAFMRPDGLRVLYATNTLAQGMNLPADQVIIVGSHRYAQDSGGRQRVAAHELLNAAGRAGRAGWASYGLVLLVPDTVITFDKVTGLPNKHDLNVIRNTIYAQDDRCLAINDPLTIILDKISPEKDSQHRLVDYLIQRLPNLGLGEGSPLGKIEFLSKSLGVYRAKQQNAEARIHQQLEWAVSQRTALFLQVENAEVDTLASAVGSVPSCSTRSSSASRTRERPRSERLSPGRSGSSNG